MELRFNITPKQFDEFVSSRVSHFDQLSSFGELKKRNEKYKYKLGGLYDKDKLIGTFVFLYKRFLSIKYAYIPYGPCMDYSEENIKEFSRLIKEYGKSNHIDFIRIDPFIEDSHDEVRQYLEDSGFKHKGYTFGYVGSFTNRHTLIIPIDDSFENVFKNFSGARRRRINRQKECEITYRVSDEKEVDVLCNLEGFLAREKKFLPHKKEFFLNYMELFKNNYVYLIVSIDLNKTLEGMRENLKNSSEEKTTQRLNKEISNIESLKNKYGDKADIAACLFIYLNDYCWDLYSYKNSDFDFLPTIDYVHMFTIQEMQKRKVKNYDMVGFSGFTNEDDPNYGLYSYKSSFGSKIVNYIGQFDLELKKNSVKNFNKYYTNTYRVIARKLNSIRMKYRHEER